MASTARLLTYMVLCLSYSALSYKFCQPPDWFLCANGKRCLASFFHCDGDNDCGDNSDEIGCPNSNVASSPATCNQQQFTCTNGHCIPLEKVCNQVHDCSDGSDEYEACAKNKTCLESEYRCTNGYCIQQRWVCDGQNDCADNSDEINCDTAETCSNEKGLFFCGNKHCISLNHTCDDKNDCEDNTDEHEANCATSKEKCDTEMHCSYQCHATPSGAVCSCPPGHRLNNQTCQDINECQENPQICDHHCINEPGTYSCICDMAYNLQADNRTCKVAKDGGDAVLIFSSKTEIRGFFLSPNEIYFPIARNLQHVVGVSLDATYIYWSDIKMGDEAIFRAFEDGTSVEVIVTAGLGMPEEIAVDWLTGNIYFTDSLYKRIGVCTNDGSHCTIIITENTERPRGLVLHPATAEMYWSDWGNTPHISRAEMDGKFRFPLVSDKLGWPNGLTIDYPNSRLYWVDAKMEIIESINLDGTDRRIVLKTVATHPFSIAVFEDKLYWSDWTTKSIHYCNKFTGKGEKVLLQEIDEIYGIHIYHSVLKPDLHNPCSTHSCEEMCLLAAHHKSTCACSPDKILAGDGQTCNRIRDASHQHLIIAAGSMFIDFYHEILGKPNMTGTYTFHHFAGVVYDSINNTLIISDQRSMTITKFDPETAESFRILNVSNEVIGGMSFDHYGNNLYWCDVEHKTIEIHSLTTMQSTILHFVEEPTSILVIPEVGMMYVTFCSSIKCHIDKMSMTGTNRIQILSEKLLGPRVSLAYDTEMERLFFADQGSGRIESISMDGTDRRLLHTGLIQPMSLAILGDEVFWTLRHSKRLFWSDKQKILSRNKGLTLLVPSEVDIMHLVTMTASQPAGSPHKCRINNGGCSHVCLVDAYQSFECRCPSGMTLSSDKQTCIVEISSCSVNEYRCSDDESCIDKTLLCDGVDHCHNGEDEENCKPTVCQPGDFTCRDNGECLPSYNVCDGISQCFDSSDEVNCEIKDCSANEFKCPSGLCIAKSWECDGQWDCEDGADEAEQCKRKTCPKSMFTCENQNCIDAILICNTVNDCGDSSDELHCIKDENVLSGICAINEYRCIGSDKCIPMEKRCDREQDCPKNDDEHHCSHCAGQEFACANLRCIPRVWMCDDEDDCGDNSDEKGCDNHKHFISLGPLHHNSSPCPEFKCNMTGRCIAWDYVCDEISDCYDNSDENGKCSTACTDEHECEQLCQRTPRGPMCRCRPGFRMNPDGKTCDDIDECQENVCSQVCHNTIGSFDCFCFDGYVLRTDRTSCKVIDGSMQLVTATKDDIRRIPPNLDVIEVIHRQPQVEITGLDVNIGKSSLYWSSELLGTIHELNTRTKQIKRMKNVGRPRVLAVDWVTDYVYYFDTEKPASIKACSPQENKCAVIVKIEGSGTVLSIAVEPEEGWLFWSQSSFIDYNRPTSEIWRSDFNGRNQTSIARENIGVVSGMTIDYERETLYWVDTSMQIIEKSNLDGSDRKVFLKEQVYQPIGINIYEDSVYWLMGSSGILQKCSLGGKNDCEAIHVKTNNVKELFVIYHSSRQRNLKNSCQNHGCDYMCVPKREEAICICHDGSQQNETGICPNSDLLTIEYDTKSLLLGKTDGFEKVEREAGAFAGVIIAIIVIIVGLSSYYYYQKHKIDMRNKYDLSIHFQNPSFNNTPGVSSDYIVPIVPPGEHEYENPMNVHVNSKIHPTAVTPKRIIQINAESDQSDPESADDSGLYNTRLIKP